MRRPALVALVALPLFACSDTDPTSPGLSPTATFSTAPIFDGAHGGNPHFFFLPPLVKNPQASGVFNPDLQPVVEICALTAAGECLDPQPAGFPIRFTMAGQGPAAIRLDEPAEHYGVNLQTRRYAFDPAVNYRILVFAVDGGEELGHVDIDVVASIAGGNSGGGGDLVTVQQGSTLPIRFRIEQGIACTDTDDCVEVVVGSEGRTVTTPTDFAGVLIPPGALDGPVLISVERVDVSVSACLPTGIPQAEGCYRYDTDPELSQVQESGLNEFNFDVVVGICIDPAVLELPEHHEYALHKFDPEQPELGILQLPSARVDFLDCEGFTALAMSEEDGAFLRLAQAGWERIAPIARLLGPARAHAVNLGFGGLAKSFSNIGWARGLTFEVLAGDDQTGPIGTTLPVDPAVRVTATHWDPDAFESAPTVAGVEVTFTFTDPAANATVVTALTNADGIATVPWVLGATAGTNTLTVAGATEAVVSLNAEAIAELVTVARVASEPDESGIPTFPTVAEAYASIATGGTILVADGVHAVSSLVISKPVTIEAEPFGEGFAEAILEGVVEGEEFLFYVEDVAAGDVIFRGLTFRNGLGGVWARVHYDHVLVENCQFLTPRGVVGDVNSNPEASLTVRNSSFTGGLLGVISSGIHMEVLNSSFDDQSGLGIAAVHSTGRIENNNVSSCSNCIVLGWPGGMTVRGNRIVNDAARRVATGIAVTGTAEAPGSAVIENNEIIGTGDPESGSAFNLAMTLVRSDVRVENNTVSGGRVGIAAEAVTGTISGNHLDTCGESCIRVHGAGSGSLVVSTNTIVIAAVDGAAYGIQATSGPGSPWLSLTENSITGTEAPANPMNPLDYPFVAGINVSSSEEASGAPVIASGNEIENAQQGIAAWIGGNVEGRDNVIRTVYHGLSATTGARNAIQFSDIVDAFIGLTGDATFAVTCNYWGGTLPPNVSTSIPTASYIPFAEVPIAGTGTTSCEPIG